MMLGSEDLNALIEEQSEITVDCEFCGNRYTYDRGSATKVLTELAEQTNSANAASGSSDDPKTLH